MLHRAKIKVHKTFTLIRTGMLCEEIISGMVAKLYPRKKVAKVEEISLAVLIAEYVKANEAKWTH